MPAMSALLVAPKSNDTFPRKHTELHYVLSASKQNTAIFCATIQRLVVCFVIDELKYHDLCSKYPPFFFNTSSGVRHCLMQNHGT